MDSQIYIFDDLHPEDNAMLQALYSRSPRSVIDHIEKVRNGDSGSFMARYYVGYGHASIGDCGSTTLYMENVSMLANKAIQDNPLYSGQEASTRYLDYSNQTCVDPYNSPESSSIQQQWMKIYLQTLEKTTTALKTAYPFNQENFQTNTQWEKAISARAFDICRSLLPCGIKSYASWHTNLRQARDNLIRLASHPLDEVKNIAIETYKKLIEKYPHSFTMEDLEPQKTYHQEQVAFRSEFSHADHILEPEQIISTLTNDEKQQLKNGELIADWSLVNLDAMNTREKDYFCKRPRGIGLSRRIIQYGTYNIYYLMDFGSFRDMQRHRNAYNPVPLVGQRFGFHPWYLQQFESLLSQEGFQSLQESMSTLLTAISNLSSKGIQTNPYADQYLYPMGMMCLCQLSCSLPQLVYIAELRSSPTVHPTVRPFAQALGHVISKTVPDLKIYIDDSPDAFSAKRGLQDITEKTAA